MQVCWMPYKGITGHDADLRTSTYKGTICATETYEPYHPDRVLRQFGRWQGIPDPPITPLPGSKRGEMIAGYTLTWDPAHYGWEDRHARIPESLRSQPVGAISLWGTVDEYPGWYARHCHPFVLEASYRHPPSSLRLPPLPADSVRVSI